MNGSTPEDRETINKYMERSGNYIFTRLWKPYKNVLNQELNLYKRLNTVNTPGNQKYIYNQLNTLHKRRNQIFNTFKQKKRVAEQYIDYLGWLNKQAKSSNYNRKMNATKKRNQVQAKLNALVRTRKRRA